MSDGVMTVIHSNGKLYYPAWHVDALAARLAEQDMQLKSYTDRLAECEAECLEQARLNGMGSEREARLIARLAHAERLLAWVAKESVHPSWQAVEAIHAFLRTADSSSTGESGVTP